MKNIIITVSEEYCYSEKELDEIKHDVLSYLSKLLNMSSSEIEVIGITPTTGIAENILPIVGLIVQADSIIIVSDGMTSTFQDIVYDLSSFLKKSVYVVQYAKYHSDRCSSIYENINKTYIDGCDIGKEIDIERELENFGKQY